MPDKFIFPLSRPIKAFDKIVTELELREPTAKEIQENGFIIQGIITGLDFTINTKVVAAYLSVLTGLPPSSIDQICAPDFYLLGAKLASFFIPASLPTLTM